ncbi:ATP-binding protein [Spirosoma pollinicola]|uniref:AAA family ATPase n=1 Tax=Spirosoma pollinicola TaxID=2057025 RepID=A0A2K8Z4Q4_9BACT|nr:ATP-binding protein [Spirosoma pollinicola]AUD04876.1 AAA family ATPase [Spirosoma pollinicola]
MSEYQPVISSVPALQAGITYLDAYIRERLSVHFGKKQTFDLPLSPDFYGSSPLASFVIENSLSAEEFIILMLALVPHVAPALLTNIMASILPQGGDLIEFGGVKGTNHRGILPTGETVLFILAGNDLAARIDVQKLVSKEHLFSRKRIVMLEGVKAGEPPMSGRLLVDADFLAQTLFQTNYVETFSSDFPAEPLSTQLEWPDLVLNPATFRQIRELETWIQYNDVLLNDWGMNRQLKPGYRALFYGPPGTGKTLTVSLLGKFTNRPVFRVDLPAIVSKYIGETEKNLAGLFDKAQNKNWILFFDEADAIFSKRTNVKDAHDKYANQEASYLLQRVESYAGIVILASNFKTNIDEAFLRRFQSVIYFPMPGISERAQLWHKVFPTQVTLDDTVHIDRIAEKYELSGSNITNVAHYCCLQALAGKTSVVTLTNLQKGIEREYAKEGRMM